MSLSKRIPMFLLRLLALGAAVSATVIMVTSHDSAQVFNVKFEAKYTNSPSFKYFVLINAIASGYTLILMFFPSKNSRAHIILVLDLEVKHPVDADVTESDLSTWQSLIGFTSYRRSPDQNIMTLLLDSSISACLAIGQVGKSGNSHAGWLPICKQVPKFCDHITGAMVAGFVAAIVYFLILLYSLHNVINLFALKT